MIKNVLFDLDGTLLPMDLEEFTKLYFGCLYQRFHSLGYDADLVLKGVMSGTKVMMENDGINTNEEVFWKRFELVTSIRKQACEEDFTNFYTHDFAQLGAHTTQNKNMMEAVNLLLDKGYRLYLTTNPLFPKMAVEQRVAWAGLQPEMFALMTSYEVCSYTKPNVNYYRDVIEKMGLEVSECMMVGNDAIEDGVIETLGIPLYLVEDHLINKNNEPLTSKWHGSSDAFLAFVKDLPKV